MPAAEMTLQDAVQEALSHNLDLAAARLGISVAESRRITAALRPNPVLSLSADHLDLLGTGFSAANNGGPPEYAIRTDFVYERGQKREYRMALAESEVGLADLQLRDVARQTMFNVQNAYVNVQQAKQNLELARSNLKSLEAIVSVNRERVRTGDLARVELDRSEVAALQYEAAIRQSELQLQQAKNNLQLLLGRSAPAANLDITGSLRRETLKGTLDDLQTQALRMRPDLLSARQTQARSQADLRLQTAQGKIDLTYGVEARRQDGVSGRGNMLGFFVSAPLPVWNRNQGEILRAQREITQNAAKVTALDASIRTEILNAWQQYSSNHALLGEIEKAMLPRAREVRDTTEYSYRRGEASLVEFLDAQRAFNDTMQTYNDARASLARSLYLIESVTAAGVAPNPQGGSN
jgi:cobalt-zinc-cadmium efflux system outer membrane protein